jgi:peptidoglycan/LPS O-acetylase OafA/YrhL
MIRKHLSGKDFTILDSIRGIAALYVTIAHCRGSLWIGGKAFSDMFPMETWGAWDYFMFGSSMLTRLAVEFVIVFFLLSGFSIAHSLSGEKSPLPFYKRRFIRIYPSYVVALLWAAAVYLLTRWLFPEWYNGSLRDFAFIRTIQMNDYFDLDVIVKNLFYMPGQGFITPFWSLTYEVIFYLLAPFLLRRVNLYAAISVVFFLAHMLAPGAVLKLGLHPYIHDFFFVYNVYFAAGAFIYRHYEAVLGIFKAVSKRLHLVFIILALGLMYAVNFYMKTESSYSFVVSALFSFFLIFYFLKYKVFIPWLINIGKFSYTLYITHLASIFLYLAIYWAIAKPGTPYILNYFVWMPAVFFCIGIAYIQYKLVESRTKEILNRLRGKGKPPYQK